MTKIDTDNPKHHKYVTTNKYERKKIKRIIKSFPVKEGWWKCLKPNVNILDYLGTYYLSTYKLIYNYCRNIYIVLKESTNNYYHTRDNYYYSRKQLIIYDDCNHKKGRIIIKNTKNETKRIIKFNKH